MPPPGDEAHAAPSLFTQNDSESDDAAAPAGGEVEVEDAGATATKSQALAWYTQCSTHGTPCVYIHTPHNLYTARCIYGAPYDTLRTPHAATRLSTKLKI